MIKSAQCWVCHRTKGPGKVEFYPMEGRPDVQIPIHGRHRISTVIRAGLIPKVVIPEEEPERS